jgi:HK97 family phage major capsid protein
MDKQEQELRQRVADLKAEAETFMNAGKNDEAKAKIAEAKTAKNELDNYIEMSTIVVPEPQNQGGIQPMAAEPKETPKAGYKNVFLKALRGKKLTEEEMSVMGEFKAALSSTVGEDGGYVVPEDIQTAINELKRSQDALEQYVNVQPVKTSKGARTIERNADSVPFNVLGAEVDEMLSPKFDRIEYGITDYAGFLPVPNDLLADTDQALEAYLKNWIAKKSKATRNSLILAQLATLSKVAFADYKGIKSALNVTLDPAISVGAKIYTNQDGFNYLDSLEDANGKPLLQPMVTDATKYQFAGREVVVLSNKTLSSTGTLAPFIVGDLNEAVVLFDREQLSIDMTREGGNAWRTNSTEFRAIEREDVVLKDAEAVVFGQIDIAPVA